jgi:hypothetical protein
MSKPLMKRVAPIGGPVENSLRKCRTIFIGVGLFSGIIKCWR